MIQITRFDQPAEGVLTPDETDLFMRRGAARVVVEREEIGKGGVTAIGVQLRRGDPPYNLLLFRVTTTIKQHRDDGATIKPVRRPTLDMCSPAQRAMFMKRIADRIAERHEDLPPLDNEPEENRP